MNLVPLQAMMSSEADFKEELEIFRREEESAQQFFCSYLALRAPHYAIEAINTTPLFWLTVQYALLQSAFFALSRIFDQNSPHNIVRLVTTAAKNLDIFAREALAKRRENSDLTAEQIDAFVSNAYEPKAEDFREIRKQILRQRRIYEARYRDVRDKVFAHNVVSDIGQANQLLAKTRVDELKALLVFLGELHEALSGLFDNGRKPELRDRPFLLKPLPAQPGARMRPGERIYRESHAVLGYVVRSVEAEQ